jgi:hypothetical protein
MEQNKRIIDLGIIPEDEISGVSAIALVEEPAIELDFRYFKKETFVEIKCSCGWSWDLAEGGQDPYICHKCGADNTPITDKFESYNDYPESAKNAAKRALEFRDKNPKIDCGTAVGWTRANQLAKGENISEETIARMASFARHLQYKDVPYTEGCGGLMVDAWGGQAGIEWASNKLKEIRGEDFEIDTTGLTPYVDPGVKKKRIEDIYSEEVLDTIIAMAAEMGVSEDDVDVVEKFTFANDKNPKDADYTPARSITKEDGIEYLYRYKGSLSSNSRRFCRRMLGLRRYWSREEIDALDTFNEDFGPGVGGGKYSIFKYKGGVNCSHSFEKYEVQRVGKKFQAIKVAPTDPIEVQAATALRNQQGNGYVKRPQRNNAPLGGGTDSFSKLLFADEEQKIVVGPAMIPNIPILRKDDDGDIYYVKFSEETIKEIAMKYMKQARTNEINQDHIEDKDAGTYIFESWIVEDPATDKANTVYGYDVPKGTWMVKMKVEDSAVWKRIKDGELRGFSVEGSFADLEELEARRNYERIKKILKG